MESLRQFKIGWPVTFSLEESDKDVWHRYFRFYDPYFNDIKSDANILEYGVAQGASIRYLRKRFAGAFIVGVDIIDEQPEWPQDDNIVYEQLDQGDSAAVDIMLHNFQNFDLVIEDGSHQPAHQASIFKQTLGHINSGGIYLLEDLHTSAGLHDQINAYHLLLAFERLLAIGGTLGTEDIKQLSTNSLFNEQEVEQLWHMIAHVDIYKRPVLPLKCYKCKQSDFNLQFLMCKCGVPLMASNDSISAAIEVK